VSNDPVNYEEFCKNINQVFESDDFNQTQFEKKKQLMVYLTNARTKTCPPS
jgi:DNA-binding transcriptional regulator WhiA